MISDAERAKRYRRKLEDLLLLTSECLSSLPILELPENASAAARALADESCLIRQQLDAENEFKKRFVNLTG